MRKHGKEKRRVWRKLHLAVDANTHQIVSAESSLDWVHYSEVLPTWLALAMEERLWVSAALNLRNCNVSL
ncbi:hypothetical protein VCRA2121O157_70118 [Vibrio crassostreae]|nr:hypothetical protein VCRA2113O138_70120 [Vibrio crassostreae]CAK2223146.1 hypothetical protein VCRA2113O140_80105 [Vibrio crassostreae]CAK3070396.1 hypothetical protein VCRA2113O139_70113 [Vibrio crassostreae]CAK3073773.1 hypothetical protein VCRA2121O154_70113 [Vibrio crassostreae]CAK3079162.1 hypothetical protein VCRA2119O148_70113 [Vibrio crassostreae]